MKKPNTNQCSGGIGCGVMRPASSFHHFWRIAQQRRLPRSILAAVSRGCDCQYDWHSADWFLDHASGVEIEVMGVVVGYLRTAPWRFAGWGCLNSSV
ncbi:hypothetical protein OAN83_00090 [Alphaproteobacteria bacterium]|nr:hypothetical protein [Alphaproteobacteria bacterium]